MALTYREILKFYKSMVQKMITLSKWVIFLKKENFEKIKRNHSIQNQGSDRTKKDVDALNDGVKEINKASSIPLMI